MLTAAELLTLIKAHNKLVSIKVSASMKRETLIKLIEDNGYKVDHKNKKIVDAKKTRPRRPKVTLKEAEDMLPKPKTALQKQKAAERKEKKAVEEKKKLRMAKKEAVEQSKKGTKKPVVKKPVVKKPVVKKPMKKEDEVRPKEKVGRPVVNPKNVKVLGVKGKIGKKEDEVRPAESSRVRPTKKKKEEPKKKERKMFAILNFKSMEETEGVEPNNEAIQKALKQIYKDFSGIERVKLNPKQISAIEEGKRPIFDISTPKNVDNVLVELKIEGDKKVLGKVNLKKKL